MAINQKLAPCQRSNEAEGSTNNSSYSSSSDDDHESSVCIEVHEGDEDRVRWINKEKPTPASLRVSPTCGKNSQRAGSRASTNAQHALLMKRLHNQLAALRIQHRAIVKRRHRVPSSSCQTSSVIADALKYRKALRKEIEQLQAALPFAQQVNVRRVESGGFQIGIACKKKSGLLVALMEAMESFGLLFVNVSVSCQNDNITIDSLSTQEIGERIGALKGVLVATIHRFNQ